jgi:hypothetical protein
MVKHCKKLANFCAIAVAVILCIVIVVIIYKQVDEHYSQSDPKLEEIRDKFQQFFSQESYWTSPLDMLNNRNVMADIKLYRGDKSYTINKQKVYICLKNDKGQYYNDNMLIYVIAHEIAHVLCSEIGHTEMFHTIFEALLVKLKDYGIYDPSLPIDLEYCENGDPEV